MSKYLPAVMLLAGPALARSQLEVTSIKAASDCVATAAVNNPNITTIYQQNRLKSVTDWTLGSSAGGWQPLVLRRLLAGMGLALAIVAMIGPAIAGRSEAERAAIVSVLVAAENADRKKIAIWIPSSTEKIPCSAKIIPCYAKKIPCSVA
jgi:hypothetical protein